MTKHQSETPRRQRRPQFTDKMVASLPKVVEITKGKNKGKRLKQRHMKPDPEQRGLYVRVMPDGPNVFVAVARDPYGKQVWHTIDSADVLTIDEARTKARMAIKRIKAGQPAVEPPPVKPASFRAVAEEWLKRYVAKEGLLSAHEIERCLNKYVLPQWADHEFVGIKRTEITALLDHVEDSHGARQADAVLAITRSIANWHAGRVDDYLPPFVRGMRRVDAKACARSRILDDAELRLVWKQAEANGSFGAVIRMLLLTGQRRKKVATMKWADIVDGIWHVPTAKREKGSAGSLALPPQALAIIKSQPKLGKNPYVFAGRADGCVDISQSKRPFDDKLPAMPHWVLHDLRRTARSLLSRSGVRRDISERVLGHAIVGVQGIYDRYQYGDEKADALRRLAALIEEIVKGTPDKVVKLKPKARANA
jgi:integrase